HHLVRAGRDPGNDPRTDRTGARIRSGRDHRPAVRGAVTRALPAARLLALTGQDRGGPDGPRSRTGGGPYFLSGADVDDICAMRRNAREAGPCAPAWPHLASSQRSGRQVTSIKEYPDRFPSVVFRRTCPDLMPLQIFS